MKRSPTRRRPRLALEHGRAGLRLLQHPDPRVGALYGSLASWLPSDIASERAANATQALLFIEASGDGARAGWPYGDPRSVVESALQKLPSKGFPPPTPEAVDAAAESFVVGRAIPPSTAPPRRPKSKRP